MSLGDLVSGSQFALAELLMKKPLEIIAEEDLVALLTSGPHNPRNFEFKAGLPTPTDAGKLEFLCDVASLANGTGGYIFYGVAVTQGGGMIVPGVDQADVPDAMTRLELASGEGLAPNVAGLAFSSIRLRNERSVMIVRVPKTWNGPHMVSFNQSGAFYSRNDGGKYLLDVNEVRSAFSGGNDGLDKVRAFKLERINTILNHSLAINLTPAPKIVLHLFPLAAFRPGVRFDLEQVLKNELDYLRPIAARGVTTRFNFDGLMAFSSIEKFAYSYVQMFNNGCIEACDGSLLENKDGRKFFPSGTFEPEIITCGNRVLELFRRLKLDPPYVAMLSCLGVRDYGMFVGSMRWQGQPSKIERDHLFMEEIVIQSADQDFSKAIRPAFDRIWNACGWAKSLNYDETGNWREFKG